MPTLLLATLACLATAAVLVAFVWRVEAGLIGLLAMEWFELTFGRDAALIGRLHLSAFDAVSMTLLAAGAIRFSRSLRVLTVSRLIAGGFVALFATSFVRGLAANGVFAAANEARGFVGPLGAMLYFAGAPVDDDAVRRYIRCYFIFALGLCLLGVLAVAGLPVGVAAWSDAAVTDLRVLPSSAAAVIAICSFFALARRVDAPGRRIAWLGTALFLCMAIYLRHRTVWVMIAGGVILLALIDQRILRRMAPASLVALVAVACLVLVEGDRPILANQSDFANSLTSTETWQWRVNGWQEFLFDSDQTPLTFCIGQPMGSGWWRIDPESHLLQSAPPHSEYVTDYLRMGVAGVVLVLLFTGQPLAILWRAANRKTSTGYVSANVWPVVVAISLIYGMTYSIEPELYALLGLASAIADRYQRESRSSAAVNAPDAHAFYGNQIRRECALL